MRASTSSLAPLMRHLCISTTPTPTPSRGARIAVIAKTQQQQQQQQQRQKQLSTSATRGEAEATTTASTSIASSSASASASASQGRRNGFVGPQHRAPGSVHGASRGTEYPFSTSARVVEQVEEVPAYITPPPRVKSVWQGSMDTFIADMRASYDPTGEKSALFSRKSRQNVPAGSVVLVETWSNSSKTNSTAFSGVLIAVRRRGLSTSFVLRTLVNKLGVEMRFNLYSPLIKQIRVISRADASKATRTQGNLRRARRAKLYFLRKDDRRIAGINKVVQALRLRESQAQRSPGSSSRRTSTK
ncbi:50s ribosomal protein l19 [Ceraceosorus bombacis]|uniref:50s ribosomal protein l19 n=1 Tax=Ceraceosorus bombacis TaxID=401625 RepID=A0A0P1B822_9BASI|nr:50s ribosomal protein l19 [Ceraceosorus bombacis]